MPGTDAQTRSRTLRRIFRNAGSHWVGDGFPVRSLFSYHDMGAALTPFLLLDYAGPTEFAATEQRRGVGEHPHRGFETVTIVYHGEVEHRDSAGGGGKIGPGDVQWMTAASGLVHEEFHGRDYARRGGKFEMVQLWVNLPAEHKMNAPRYQGILDSDIPVVSLPQGGTARVIAGEFEGLRGPAQTFSPVLVCDLALNSTEPVWLPVPRGWTAMLVVLQGSLQLEAEVIGSAEVALFDTEGEGINVSSTTGLHALLLCGEQLAEPIVGSGPFVMNSAAEIHQAISDYQSGKMGHLDQVLS